MSIMFPLAADAAMREYYNQRASEYDEWYLREGVFARRGDAERWHAEVAQLRERVQQFGQGRLLEIASGTGWWTQHLAQHAHVTVLDYAPAMLAQLGARLDALGLHAIRVRGDAYALPFAATCFDCAFFGFWLSHVPHTRQLEFLHEVRRVLHPGSEVMIIDSAPTTPDQVPGAEFLHERVLNDGSRHQVLKIVHTPDSLAQALARLGEVTKCWSTGRYFSVAIVKIS